jgi:UPF0716 protein FxsA
MVGLLIVLFLVVPIVELTLIVAVAGQLGVLPTIGLLLLVSVAGGWLMRREGVGLLNRVRDELGRGELPATGMIDGVLLLVGGALMLTPGFLTDTIGLLLLVPPVRALVRAGLVRRFQRRIEATFAVPGSVFVPGAASARSSWTGGGVVVREYVGDVAYDLCPDDPPTSLPPTPGSGR